MNYTHAQILELTGMTQERLRHWRKEIPGLDKRASRGGTIQFEEVALLAVLSQATDELGISAGLVAAHYDDILAEFQENEAVGEPDVVLWLGVDAAAVGPISAPPDLEIAVVVWIEPIIQRLYGKIRNPGSRQLSLALSDSDAR